MDETGAVEGLFAASETWTDSRLAWAKDRAIVAQFHALCDRLLAAQGEIHPGWNDEYFEATWVRWLVDEAKRLQLPVEPLPDAECEEVVPESPAETPLEAA